MELQKSDLIKLYEIIINTVSDEDIKKLVMYLEDYIHNGSVMSFESEEDW